MKIVISNIPHETKMYTTDGRDAFEVLKNELGVLVQSIDVHVDATGLPTVSLELCTPIGEDCEIEFKELHDEALKLIKGEDW